MDEISEFEIRQENLSGLLEEMESLSQPRSNFALRHFVVGQHDRPARQRQQVLLELQTMMFTLADTADNIKLDEIDIRELEEKIKSSNGFEAERTWIEISRKKRNIQSNKLSLSGRIRECDYLYSMLGQIPEATSEQLESEEAEYWKSRLTRQYLLAQRDAGGNLTAILEMLTEPGQNKPEVIASFENVVGVLCLPEGMSHLIEEIE